MPDPIGIGASIIGGALGSRAARRARASQDAATQRAIARQDEARDTITGRLDPYADTGARGLTALDRFSYNPTTAADVYNDPGYQFARDEGLKNTQGTEAARGGLYSGNALKELTEFAQGNANRFFSDAFNRNQTDTNNRFGRAMQTTGVGEHAVAGQNQATSHNADQVSGLYTGQGNAQAASQLAEGRAWQDALNGAAGAAGGGGGGGGGGYMPNAPIPFAAPGANYNPAFGVATYKDGGPVMVQDADGRMVPKLGTRTPLPGAGGGGGGLSREAILAELSKPAAPPAAVSAPMVANPLTSPKAIIEDQIRKAGGYACGGSVRRGYADGGPVTDEELRIRAYLRQNQERPIGGKERGLPTQRSDAMGYAFPRLSSQSERDAYDAVMNYQEQALQDLVQRRGGRVDYGMGGTVDGAGGPRDDAIPAWLSDGEDVVNAADVAAVGGHSALHRLVRQGKRRAY